MGTALKPVLRGLLCTALWLVASGPAWSQTTVSATPGNCANVAWATGTQNWGNANRAETQNDSGATVTVNDGQVSEYLRCTDYGFAIPTSATINGIAVTVRRIVSSTTGGSIVDDQVVQLVKANAVTGDNKARAQPTRRPGSTRAMAQAMISGARPGRRPRSTPLVSAWPSPPTRSTMRAAAVPWPWT